MKVLASLFLGALAQCCFGAATTNTVASSDWSATVGSLRGRLLILDEYFDERPHNDPETVVYVELQNVGRRDLDIYCDFQEGLQCELRDAKNEPPPPVGTGGSGGFPGPRWISLARDSSTRLRASWCGYGMPKDKGLNIPLFHELILLVGNTNQYFLSGTFTASPSTNRVQIADGSTWRGTLLFPKMKISSRRL